MLTNNRHLYKIVVTHDMNKLLCFSNHNEQNIKLIDKHRVNSYPRHIIIIMRKSSERRGRISRTFLPSSSQPSHHAPQQLVYFRTIQGNIKLLDKYDPDKQTKRSDHSFNGRRFRLSKRLEELAHTRPQRKWIQQDVVPKTDRQAIHKRSQSMRGAVGDGVYQLQLANINKTISGTRLGALSALKILEQMQSEEQQQGSTFHGFDRQVERMDSEMPELPMQARPRMGLRKGSIGQGKGIERHMEAIYGGQDNFMDKYRQYQISLLEKIPSYRSRHLTLDYKNQWRV